MSLRPSQGSPGARSVRIECRDAGERGRPVKFGAHQRIEVEGHHVPQALQLGQARVRTALDPRHASPRDLGPPPDHPERQAGRLSGSADASPYLAPSSRRVGTARPAPPIRLNRAIDEKVTDARAEDAGHCREVEERRLPLARLPAAHQRVGASQPMCQPSLRQSGLDPQSREFAPEAPLRRRVTATAAGAWPCGHGVGRHAIPSLPSYGSVASLSSCAASSSAR